jgi:hypothetical protein
MMNLCNLCESRFEKLFFCHECTNKIHKQIKIRVLVAKYCISTPDWHNLMYYTNRHNSKKSIIFVPRKGIIFYRQN